MKQNENITDNWMCALYIQTSISVLMQTNRS